MDFFRCCMLYAATLFYCNGTNAQAVYYPSQSSSLLKSTAVDVAALFQKAMPSSTYTAQSYNAIPQSGIIFVYDTTITGIQACKVESNGTSFIRFSAAEDNSLCFGIYQYLQQLGFRFYQPGSAWEMIPSLTSPYKIISTSFTSNYKYKSWNISGGHNRWIMDNSSAYGWDTYYGENGHQWALYQRRNGMTGAYRFSGHRGDVLSGNYMATLQNNPCYVACYNGSRQAVNQSVPDVNNNNATQLWADAIEQKYTQFKNTIYGNTGLYTDYYHSFGFNYGHIGIEGPDGARWGNSGDNNVCSTAGYPKESDQQFILAGKTAEKINSIYPGKRMQCYAYSSHADIPSSNININTNLDVQVISTAFQNESSPKGLLNRWYNRYNNVSEYHYLNIPQWGGETPMFSLDDMKATLQRLKEKSSQGIVWEASPAKFATLPFLLAANNKLLNGTEVDSTLKDFCNNMFGAGAATVYQLLQLWGDEKSITTGEFIADNKYKLPLYLQLLNTAVQQTQNESALVKQRLSELKVYLHYMQLYYDWLFDQRSNQAKKEKAAALCTYLARINRLQVVNSYFLITDIVSRYPAADSFNVKYNTQSGSAYQGGNLPLITTAEIESDFINDLSTTASSIGQYELKTAGYILSRMNGAGLNGLRKINVKIGYTNGYNYPNRSEFFIQAPAAGSFTIAYSPRFDMPGQGTINFTVEAADQALQVIKDITLNNGDAAGSFTVSLPASGRYKLSVVSKNKSAVDLSISTNGNYFYKNTAFLGNKTENYRNDLLSLPGYFYVPVGVSRVYFSINNGNPGGAGFATASTISAAFLFRDDHANEIIPQYAGTGDSALFYLPVNPGTDGAFLKVSKMEQYDLCFANISNILWYAEKNYCASTNFVATLVNKNGECFTRLTASVEKSGYKWTVIDGSRTLSFGNRSSVDLPDYISPNAVITLQDADNCFTSKRLGDDTKYLRSKEACASGTLPAGTLNLSMFPNPSSGIFNCVNEKAYVKADEIMVFSSQGSVVASVKDVSQVNLSGLSSGMYYYQCRLNGQVFKGKLVKL